MKKGDFGRPFLWLRFALVLEVLAFALRHET